MKGVLSKQIIIVVTVFMLLAIGMTTLISLHLIEIEQDKSREATIEKIQDNWLPLISRHAWTFSMAELRLALQVLSQADEVELVSLEIRGYGGIEISNGSREPSIQMHWPIIYRSLGLDEQIGELKVSLYDPGLFDMMDQHLYPSVIVDGIRSVLIILPIFFLVQFAITNQLKKLSMNISMHRNATEDGVFPRLVLRRKKIFSQKDEFDDLVDAYNQLVESFNREQSMRRNRETELSQSLEEKKILLKEVHHRVKNNLQIVMSLIHLQSSKASCSEDKNILLEAEHRIGSLAIVHEQLYAQDDLGSIDINTYIERLLSQLRSSFSDTPRKQIETIISGEQVFIPVDRAIPLALIVNELCTNAFEHAFDGDKNGKIWVEIETIQSGILKIAVHDNGSGLPTGFRHEETEGFGFTIIRSLLMQLDAELSTGTNQAGGAVFTISFPLEARPS